MSLLTDERNKVAIVISLLRNIPIITDGLILTYEGKLYYKCNEESIDALVLKETPIVSAELYNLMTKNYTENTLQNLLKYYERLKTSLLDNYSDYMELGSVVIVEKELMIRGETRCENYNGEFLIAELGAS